MPRSHKSANHDHVGRGVPPARATGGGDLACPVCGETRYYLELRADTRADRGGLAISCSRCHATRNVFDKQLGPP